MNPMSFRWVCPECSRGYNLKGEGPVLLKRRDEIDGSAKDEPVCQSCGFNDSDEKTIDKTHKFCDT